MKKLFIIAVLALMPFSGLKADPIMSYNTFDLAYRLTDPEHGENFNGLVTHLSISPANYLFGELGYNYDAAEHANVNSFIYGIGGYYPVIPEFHLVGRLGGIYERVHVDLMGTENENRFYIGPEFRSQPICGFELNGGYRWNHRDDDNLNELFVGALVKVFDPVAVLFNADFLEHEAQAYTMGLRFGF